MVLENDLNITKYKIKFLKAVMSGEIVLNNKYKSEVVKKLTELKYPQLSLKISFEPEELELLVNSDDEDEEEEEEEEEEEDVGNKNNKNGNKNKNKNKNNDSSKSYGYLTNLALFSVTKEKLAKLQIEHDERKVRYELYVKTPAKQLWLNELKELSDAYAKWLAEVEYNSLNEAKKALLKKNNTGKKVAPARKRVANSAVKK
jgi:DNA topoisomerase-2